MTDRYEFEKSVMDQSIEEESPFVSKNWAYINDLNNGVYTNNGTSLCTIDMSSIYNSTAMNAMDSAFVVVPLIYTYVLSSDTASNSGTANLLTPNASTAWSLLALKAGYWNLINSVDLTVDGKTIEMAQNMHNVYVGYKLLSQFSQDDVNSFGQSLGFGDSIEGIQSLRYNNPNNITGTSTGAYPAQPSSSSCFGGNGVSNNFAFNYQSPITTSDNSASAVSNSASITLSASNSAIAVGQLVVGAGIPQNTFVSAISGTGLTLTQKATVSASATLYFYNPSVGSNSAD